MVMIPGILTAAGGLFLFLWYRTVAGLPSGVQPSFVRSPLFKWGFPPLSLAAFAVGICLVAAVSPWWGAVALAAAVLLAAAVVRFDRHSAQMRVVYDHYRRVREENPDIDEIEALFHTVRRRYPKWQDDRVVALAAGKNIKELILLIIVQENGINPLSDWDLYRSLRQKASRITGLPE